MAASFVGPSETGLPAGAQLILPASGAAGESPFVLRYPPAGSSLGLGLASDGTHRGTGRASAVPSACGVSPHLSFPAVTVWCHILSPRPKVNTGSGQSLVWFARCSDSSDMATERHFRNVPACVSVVWPRVAGLSLRSMLLPTTFTQWSFNAPSGGFWRLVEGGAVFLFRCPFRLHPSVGFPAFFPLGFL